MASAKIKKLIRRSCIHCGVEFETFNTRKVYHSKKCKESARGKRRRYTTKHKEYQRKYQLNWRKKNPQKAKEIRDKHQKSEKRREYLRRWRKSRKQKKIIKKYLRSKKGQEWLRNYREKNRERLRLIDKQSRDKKRGYSIPPLEKINLTCKNCGKRFKPRDKFKPFLKFCSKRCSSQYFTNKYRKESPDKVKESYKKYIKSEKGKFLKFKRHSRRRGLYTPFSFEKYKRITERDLFCVYCGSSKATEIEHLIPLEKGGTNDINNLVLACKSCNSSKYTKDLKEWLESPYCIKNNITETTINPIVWELIKKQKDQRKLTER